MLSKLEAVAGDISKSGFGLEEPVADTISTQVHFIINSAANTTFDERYKPFFFVTLHKYRCTGCCYSIN